LKIRLLTSTVSGRRNVAWTSSRACAEDSPPTSVPAIATPNGTVDGGRFGGRGAVVVVVVVVAVVVVVVVVLVVVVTVVPVVVVPVVPVVPVVVPVVPVSAPATGAVVTRAAVSRPAAALATRNSATRPPRLTA
jgi:hypothetical protein